MSNLETAIASRPSPGWVWEELFEEMCERIGPLIGRLETRKRAKAYIRGLLSQVDRKNGWQLAEELGEKTPYSIQYFLDRSKWDADVLRDELQKYVCEKLGDKNGIGVLDETGFLRSE